MNLDATDLHPSQAFRLRTPPGSSTQADIVTVKTRLDNKTDQHIVLWKDVLLYFENAKCAMKAGEIVAFLTDDSFVHLEPLRIDHHPGVVLDVIVSSTGQNTIGRARDEGSLQQTVSTVPAAPSFAMGMLAKATALLRRISLSYAAADGAESVTQQVTALSILDQTPSHKCPVVCSTKITQQLTMSPQVCPNQCFLQLRDTQYGQMDIAAEVHKNRSLQEQMLRLQQQMDEKDRIAQKQLLEAQQHLLKKQEQIIQMQQ
ncbi:hypothetical protein BGZ54_010598 [Gamsiella multidivaricata]|nr:hypothetical protein BGZ54_010598 [Gamsiella multidivaricata]